MRVRSIFVVLGVLAGIAGLGGLAPLHAADYSKLFKATNPAVAVLYTSGRVANPASEFGEAVANGLGSGFLVDDEGHVMTAAHVVQTADLVRVEFSNGFRTTAAIIASDPVKDVALLKLDEMPESISPLKLGNSDKVEIGEEVFVIGAPYGLSHTLTVGHISGRHANDDEMMGAVKAETFQSDAAINQGNSGGPMFNQRGEVIGIVSHIRSKSGGSEGLGFAVTANAARDALFENRMAWSGLSGFLLAGEIAKIMNVPQPYGYLVQQVAAGSPAARVGLRPSRIPATIAGQDLFVGGDIILSVGDVAIAPDMTDAVRSEIGSLRGTDLLSVVVLRGGKRVVLEAVVRPR